MALSAIARPFVCPSTIKGRKTHRHLSTGPIFEICPAVNPFSSLAPLKNPPGRSGTSMLNVRHHKSVRQGGASQQGRQVIDDWGVPVDFRSVAVETPG
jgi:hypothetical protein